MTGVRVDLTAMGLRVVLGVLLDDLLPDTVALRDCNVSRGKERIVAYKPLVSFGHFNEMVCRGKV